MYSKIAFFRETFKNYAPELKKILRKFGCYFERQGKGDHEIWYSPISKLRFLIDGKCGFKTGGVR
jgi:hypothetical protein